MASAEDTYPWATYSVIVKTYLDTVGEDDSIEQVWWLAALDDCDQFVGWDWTDDDGNDVDHDKMVFLGLLEWMKAMKGYFDRAGGAGVGMVKTGPLQENYRTDAGGLSVALARAIAYPLWQPSKYDVSLLGLGYQ